MHKYHFDIKMSCEACSRAIDRVLGKLDGTGVLWHCRSGLTTGVSSYTVSLEKQSVDVEGSVPFDTVLEKIKNTGKEVLGSKVVA